ncbi:MAG TPA: hypothetical protein VIV12_12485 [Streptosporangiaceae bacterium]
MARNPIRAYLARRAEKETWKPLYTVAPGPQGPRLAHAEVEADAQLRGKAATTRARGGDLFPYHGWEMANYTQQAPPKLFVIDTGAPSPVTGAWQHSDLAWGMDSPPRLERRYDRVEFKERPYDPGPPGWSGGGGGGGGPDPRGEPPRGYRSW